MEDLIMKRQKCLLLIVLVLATSMANAQFRFGVKGGVNIATVKFNEDVLKSENITGFHIGPLFEYIPAGGLGLDFAILYSQKGLSVEPVRENFVSNYIEVPVNLKMKIGIPVISPYFAAGPYVSFLIGGDKELSIPKTGSTILGQIKTKSFGAGLNFTAGVEILKHLQVGATYNWGLTDHFDTFNASDLNSYKGKPHTWMISATLLF